MTVALIIEASMESYFMFWLQSNFSLPDILDIISFDNFELEHLLQIRIISIILSCITITVPIIKVR